MSAKKIKQLNSSGQKEEIVAYLSMEIAVDNQIKTYAGGLGVLAGDILRSAADSNYPLVGITLLNNRGYFKQSFSSAGEQIEQADSSYDFTKLKKLSQQIIVKIGEEKIKVGVWRYTLSGASRQIEVYFLDTNLEGNSRPNRELTGELYGGNNEYRLKQEIILGRGAVKMLAALGYHRIKKFHLNEGHGALAAVELFLNVGEGSDAAKLKEVRHRCVFTTHTPLLKSQDIFSAPYFLRYQPDFPIALSGLANKGEINLTRLGFYFSAYSNAVSQKHRTTTERLFPDFKMAAVTNGVNSFFWTAPEFRKLYDQYLPGWRQNGGLLAQATKIPAADIWIAHQKSKGRLLSKINNEPNAGLKKNVFTIGFARRFAPYKRPEFLFADLEKLAAAQKAGEIQIILAGKAHPQDLDGQELIKQVWQNRKKLAGRIKIFFWEDYDLKKAQLMTAGVDLWLNTPLAPNEASGTSGMKAAHNGVPQLSTLDGWWPEGYVKNKTGWTIDEAGGANNIYHLLEKEILPLFYRRPDEWRSLMASVISLNASFFNTDRVLRQYIEEAY